MSLYDGLGLESKDRGHKDQKPDLAGWSMGIKLLQSQLQLKKAVSSQPKRESCRKGGTVMAPVVDLKSRREELDEMPPPPAIFAQTREIKCSVGSSTASLLGGEWDIRAEYDPLWPNDYEKILKERRERREKDEKDKHREERKHRDRGDRSERGDRDRERRDRDRSRGDEDEEMSPRPHRGSASGAAIAPPPSLMQDISTEQESPGGKASFGPSSVAQRIMARYGYKAGQGLGKQEQGMSQALLVEKTSKRGGKIIHEKDLPKEPLLPPPPPPPVGQQVQQIESITDMMKNPSKVVLLRNMVGPGEVDDDLEPETKEECSKYGEVVRCVIFEIPGGNVCDEEAVRIFIEFKRLESAIKAVVDTNGRYFGGRIVKASFYDHDKFKRLELGE
uniref:Splicing factor 45 n=1 Tax=Ornithodoros turicata TaxID=34597 RepID=A0A2R5LK48_9ACAR